MQVSTRLLAASTSVSVSTTTLHRLAATRKGLAKVVLKKGKTQLFKDGSPMVYSGAVDRIVGRPPPKTGDVVLVADGAERAIGWGVYNSFSMYCVRLMQMEEEAARDSSCTLDLDKLIEMRISAAVELRMKLGLPSEDTNAYRLVNSEGDRLSGLIVDVFGDAAVVASSAAWVENCRARIEQCLSSIPGLNNLIWRPSIDILKEEGLDLSNSPSDDNPTSTLEVLKIIENGICYYVSTQGQKTGFYADQRENRQFISLISRNQKVLDVYCYSGGFALNAAKGGAVSVTGIDSSLPAVERAKENVFLNKMDPQTISFLREDASEFMKDAASRQETWDIVILDPPKLAPRKKVLQSGSGMYRNLNSLAMKITRKGGLLMTCSCSGAVTQSGTFQRIIQGAALAAGRKITILRQAGAACDHPIDPAYPEGAYLTNFLVRVL